MSSPLLPSHTTRIVLAERTDGEIGPTTFKSETVVLETLLPTSLETVLVRVDYVSIDPTQRGWIKDERSYMTPVEIGETMRATGVGTIVRSNAKDFKVGDVVKGYIGWTEYALVPVKGLTNLTMANSTKQDYVDAMANLVEWTAYFGLNDIGRLQPGETLVVSGAAGAVGSIVCQLGRIKGAGKIVGIAGGPEKCRLVETEFGADVCLDYKSKSFEADFVKEVGYLDVYFDNVGGSTLDLALTRLKKFARIVACGAISGYNDSKPYGITNFYQVIVQSATVQGFIVSNFASRFKEASEELRRWKQQGKLKLKFHVGEGLESCPEYLKQIFRGVNTGKLIVKVSSKDPSDL